MIARAWLCPSRLGDGVTRILGAAWVRCTVCEQVTPAGHYVPELDAYTLVSHPRPSLPAYMDGRQFSPVAG